MPSGNGMGPEGRGPITGRGLGPCSDRTTTGKEFFGRGRGMAYGRGGGWGRGIAYGCGRGLGYGRGFGRGAEPMTPPPEVERWNLERETEYLRAKLARAETRLKELGGTPSESKGE